MRKEILNIFENLDQEIENRITNERLSGETPFLTNKVYFKILGQLSLLLDNKAPIVLHLNGTIDMDTNINNGVVKKMLEDKLNPIGLNIDPNADKIWLPKESEFSIFFRGKKLIVDILTPLHALTSKAVKAPLKNKLLIREALLSDEYGEELFRILLKYGVNPEGFMVD